VPEAIEIGRRAFRTIQQNLWFTAAYNVVGIACAAVGWLPPIAAAAAQSLPDVAVMLNSARLLRSAERSEYLVSTVYLASCRVIRALHARRDFDNRRRGR
jgi:hypothetical protein